MKSKVLLIVPHQDDELFVGGGLLKLFADSGDYEINVVFTTDGDFFPWEGEVRLRESLRVLTELYGIEDKNISFLGYGDCWCGNMHLYNLPDSRVVRSSCGRCETYGIAGHEDFRKIKSGKHSLYCRDNFKSDLKELLSDIMADIIIAVDYDKHPDHKAASLIAEECIGELLREHLDYQPLVLKRFAYDGVWKGKADFFDFLHRRTVLSQLEASPYLEEDKICIGMPPECSTPYLRHNFFYRVAKCYRTQEVWQKADEVINVDEVYFKRNTDNLLYEAKLTASSGQAEFLRDFKLYDCGDVLQKDFVLKECAWLPDGTDLDRKLHIHFKQPRTIAQINLYALGNPGQDKLEGEFIFDNGMCLQTGSICLNGKKNKLTLESKSGISDIDFCITNSVGRSVGITELEILSQRDDEVPEELREYIFQGDSFRYSAMHKMEMQIEKAKLSMKRKLFRWFPNQYVIKRFYPELGQRKCWLLLY